MVVVGSLVVAQVDALPDIADSLDRVDWPLQLTKEDYDWPEFSLKVIEAAKNVSLGRGFQLVRYFFLHLHPPSVLDDFCVAQAAARKRAETKLS